jgi:hypothetical protein
MESIFGKARWAIFNARTGEVTYVDHMPFEVGSDEAVDLRLTGAGVAGKHMIVNDSRGEVGLLRRDAVAEVIVNGSPTPFASLKANTDYTVDLGSERLIVHGARKIEQWAEKKQADFAADPKGVKMMPAGVGTPAPGSGEGGSSGFKPNEWSMIDCQTGEITRIDKLPFEIGSGADTDLHLEGVYEHQCAIEAVRGRGVWLVRRQFEADLWLNGIAVENQELLPDTDYTLQFGPHLFLLRGGASRRKWEENLDLGQWFVFDPEKGFTEGPFLYLADVLAMTQKPDFSEETIAFPNGMGMGFYLRQLRLLPIEFPTEESIAAAVSASTAAQAQAEEDAELLKPTKEGGLICPVCWLEFDAGDLMHVAVHDSLRGDPILGEDAPQRFLATRFNDRGQALDALGLPCTEIACPHCRRAIPPAILEGPQHILSIVGDQSAGKSYYLTTLIKTLPVTLFNHFDVVFQDADPTGNAPLNEMKKTLFSARSPEEARLAKTQLEGAMYERLPRYGRTVALPKPFIYTMESKRRPEGRCSVIFYDNAGEHFQPTRDSADSPGAQHVASSSGIFFLFDPFNHPDFRARLGQTADPQLENPIVDQQEVILAEMKARIRKLRRLQGSERIEQPMAVLVGKCDAWLHLLGPEPLANPLPEGKLDHDALEKNSERIRTLLLQIAPTIVANAETISAHTHYFPVSSFGHAPVRVPTGDVVPDPRRIQPFMVEVPPLWIFSLIAGYLLAPPGADAP